MATVPEISHATLDQLPASQTRDYVRGLLIERGALPRRDETKIRFQRWVDHGLRESPTRRCATSPSGTSGGTTCAA